MTTLGKLLDDLGPTVLRVLSAPRGLDVEVTDVAIYDPADPEEFAAGRLVIGIGLPPGVIPASVLRDLGDSEAAGLLIKATDRLDPSAIAAAEGAKVAVLSVPTGAIWMQMVMLLRSIVSQDGMELASERLDGVAVGDLFAVANAIAAMVDAPVTIEDPASRVIAFSNRQEEADPARIATVLGRQAPDANVRRMREHGVFRRMYKSAQPIFIKGRPPDILPRVAVAVRAGDEVLGSIWAAVREPLAEERMSALGDAARAVSLHLLRHRLAADARMGLQLDLISTVLNGGSLAADAARRLGLEARGYQVIGVGVLAGEGVDPAGDLNRAAELLALHMNAVHRNAVTAAIGDVVYSIVPASTGSAAAAAAIRTLAEGFIRRARPVLGDRLVVGLGALARSLEEIPRARAQADQVVRVLHLEPGRGRVATIEDVGLPALLMRLGDISSEDTALGSQTYRQLVAHDELHHTKFVETVRAWLRAFGDNEEAAKTLAVHANTVRLRLRDLADQRIADMRDPDVRLGLMLHFRLDELRPATPDT